MICTLLTTFRYGGNILRIAKNLKAMNLCVTIRGRLISCDVSMQIENHREAVTTGLVWRAPDRRCHNVGVGLEDGQMARLPGPGAHRGNGGHGP